MSLTVTAHFNKGIATPFPPDIEHIPGEGVVFRNPHDLKNGGIIMTSYCTEDMQMLISSFKKHLANHDLTLLCIHKVGELRLCYSETSKILF